MRWLTDHLIPWRFRRQVQQKAADLIMVYGSRAYTVAREEARRRPRGDRGRRDRFWTAVAIAVADAEGREVGVTGADRFLRGE